MHIVNIEHTKNYALSAFHLFQLNSCNCLKINKRTKRTVSIDQGDPFVRYIKFRFVKDYYENYISIKPKQTKKLLLTK